MMIIFLRVRSFSKLTKLLMKILSNSNKSSLIGERFHLSDFKGSNVSTESWDYGLLKLSYISKNLN